MQAEDSVITDRRATIIGVKSSLGICLADAANTLMMEVDAELRNEGRCLKHETKMRFNQMKQSAKDLQYRMKEAAKVGYILKDADHFCEDSDWIKDLVLLIVDRVGDNDEKMLRLRAMIYNMQSEMNIYQNS